jgi:hypothetical protein
MVTRLVKIFGAEEYEARQNFRASSTSVTGDLHMRFLVDPGGVYASLVQFMAGWAVAAIVLLCNLPPASCWIQM